eukprot:TRINITY_DN13168_c0_g1_i1.p1 TRINITY_DN13168_c0_g1~~TRINITY_DN13168_c0_g1_i1.p1  ORF type:complete len:102 (-),score=12.01 TRINITY_DN13168_c0_g1_i1:155-460(-)
MFFGTGIRYQRNKTIFLDFLCLAVLGLAVSVVVLFGVVGVLAVDGRSSMRSKYSGGIASAVSANGRVPLERCPLFLGSVGSGEGGGRMGFEFRPGISGGGT